MFDDTIAAISTPLAAGAISVIRISGNKALSIADKIFKCDKLKAPSDAEPEKMYLGKISVPNFTERCFFVYFKAPKSYTGEDLVEFQCHGGVKITEKVLEEILKRGAVLSGKGEFTRRAFINGKLSLSDAENLIEMINAESDCALISASRLLYGNFGKEIKDFFNAVTDLIAESEAVLDYPDETEDLLAEFPSRLETIYKRLKFFADGIKISKAVKDGITVAIIGIPNVGKSSLLNSLLNKDRAIVSDKAGTTRDVVEDSFEYDGFKINILDTAGIRKSTDEIEMLGTEKAKFEAENADLVLFVTEADRELFEEEKELLKNLNSYITVKNKSDKLKKIPDNTDKVIYVSSKYNKNINAVSEKIVSFFRQGFKEFGGEIVTSLRHAELIKESLSRLKDCIDGAKEGQPLECILIDLKESRRALGKIIGDTADEGIIDAIFSKFCLGK